MNIAACWLILCGLGYMNPTVSEVCFIFPSVLFCFLLTVSECVYMCTNIPALSVLLILIIFRLKPGYSPSQPLISLPTNNVQKPGSGDLHATVSWFLSQNPGKHIQVSETRIWCFDARYVTGLKKPDHNQIASVHVNTLSGANSQRMDCIRWQDHE